MSWRDEVRTFDRLAEIFRSARRLPHWSQAGTLCFITWRTWDSIPAPVLDQWLSEREAWLRERSVDVDRPDWRQRLASLDPPLWEQCQRHFAMRWNEHLDKCHGACVLRDQVLAQIVADSLLHFDGERYVVTDFIIMPNHLHVVAAFPGENDMLKQCSAWKHFTAAQIHRRLGRRGRFWQSDAFDHLIRSDAQFEAIRRYIADNPRHAGLRKGEYLHYSKE